MPDTPGAAPVPDKDDERDENDPGEVASMFVTKGLGWSGRDGQEDDSEPPA